MKEDDNLKKNKKNDEKDIKKEEVKEEKQEVKKEDENKEEKIEITKEEVMELNRKITEQEQKFLRAQADLVNYRKRKDEEVERLLKFANEDLILDVLPILDNFERAIALNASENGDLAKFKDGIVMVYNSLKGVLEKYGVKEIDALDKPFDPMYHEAVTTKTNDEKEKDVVLQVYQKGYTLKDKVIRPAMVEVNK